MRILVVSLYFPPDMGAPAGRFYDYARQWIRRGHSVTVITGLPHFPAGIIHDEYRGVFYRRETLDGIDVRRCWLLSARRRSLAKALNYGSFLISSILCVLFAPIQYDVVVATSPPPTVGISGVVASWRRRVPLVFDIRDIWPEAIVQSGRLTNPLLIRLFEGTAHFIYRSAARVTAVTEGWVERLREIGVPNEKLAALPNGVDVRAFDSQAEEPLPAALDILDPEACWFTYAGIFNTPQGLEVILEAAALLRDREPVEYHKAQFVFVGEGPTHDVLEERSRELGLDRVVFIPRQPRAAIFGLLRRSFAVIVSLRPRKDTSTVPSKIYESLASSRPVLFSAGGEGAETIRQAGGGVVCSPGDPEPLFSAILDYLKDPDRALSDGASGRRYVEAHYDRSRIADEFAELLEGFECPSANPPKRA